MKKSKHSSLKFVVLLLVTFISVQNGFSLSKLGESFSTATFPPTGWNSQHVAGLLGGGTWHRATSQFHSSPGCAESDGALLGDNYLITKRIKPEAGDSLVFYVSSNYLINALGRLDVKVSTTDSLVSSLLDFLIPININLSLLTPNVYYRQAIDLTPYAGQNIYLAFRHIEVIGLGAVRLDGISVGGVDLTLTVMMEARRGFTVFESPIRDRDTVTVSIRSDVPPFNIVDSRKVFLDTFGIKTVNFAAGQLDVPYYIVVENRNSVRTWSSNALTFEGGVLNYDFTSAITQAFGDNQHFVLGNACMYQGDINNDGVINLIDMIQTYNDGVIFLEGPYVLTDYNWDFITNLQDIILCHNNGVAFVSEKKPF